MPQLNFIPDLSLDLKAAQLVMPGLHPERYAAESTYRDDVSQLIELGVGGFCVFRGEIERTAQILAELQAQADVPLIFSADFEHGLPMRLEGGTDFPHAMAIGRTRDAALAAEVASAIALEAKSIGIHWNLAPVCDVNSNRANPIINVRAFGERPEEVIPFIEAWIQSTQAMGVAACAKHFPGHGDCVVDSHIALALLEHSLERLTECELPPFYAAVQSGVKSIMMAHIAVPALDSSGIPASLSRMIVQEFLRDKMRYKGIVVSDALDMKAIADTYSSAEAARAVISAGADVALVPVNPVESVLALKEAVINTALPATRVQESFDRLMELKQWCGLLGKRRMSSEAVSLEAHGMLALRVAQRAVQVGGSKDILPIEKYNHIAAFAVLSGDDINPASEFFQYLAQVYEGDTDIAYINSEISDDQIESYQRDTSGAECVIFAVFVNPRAYQGSVQLPARLSAAMQKLRGDRRAIAVLFGNPYLDEVIAADAYIRCYSDSKASRGAACLALAGKSI